MRLYFCKKVDFLVLAVVSFKIIFDKIIIFYLIGNIRINILILYRQYWVSGKSSRLNLTN